MANVRLEQLEIDKWVRSVRRKVLDEFITSSEIDTDLTQAYILTISSVKDISLPFIEVMNEFNFRNRDLRIN